MNLKYLLLLSIIIITSCNTKKEIVNDDIQIDEIIISDDTNSESFKDNNISNENKSRIAEKKSNLIKGYKSSNTLYHDLIHTELHLSFNYSKKQVYGIAKIKLKPYFYPSDTLILDAQYFDIHNITLSLGENSTPLDFTYDSLKIKIKLDQEYINTDTFKIEIKYTANPDKIKSSGSWAIRSNKGLYFIQNDSNNPQIWTQGETQSNSGWFPTIDSPNQNMSQDIFLTVDKKFKTLSNGRMVSSLINKDETRTDHWKQEKSHAPYLTMIAIGNFEIIEDYWRDLPVFVYAEKNNIKKAKLLFENTYKMIEFYSRKLNYDFPWDKYSQIIVKNFVSGAMENTGAVVFGDYVLNFSNETERRMYESVVAHELSHHWFGDLVTCESWANLPLNESFATYFEYLWLEHEYSRNIADIHLAQDYNNYKFERFYKDENLIRFYNKHRDNMFDAHSYQKGGMILHMLRYTVGDKAFWKSLELYLKTNEFKPVEIHHLRLAFEEVTGQDLNWFFNQWFLNKGIPELNISYSYDDENKKAKINIEQTQNLKKFPLYKIPTFIDLYFKDKVVRKSIVLDEQKEVFEFEFNEKPLFMNFDPHNSILCKKKEDYSNEELIEILDKAPLFDDKNMAFDKLNNFEDNRLDSIYYKYLNHEYWRFRYLALQRININKSNKLFNEYLNILIDLSVKDENIQVRNLAKKKHRSISSENSVKE